MINSINKEDCTCNWLGKTWQDLLDNRLFSMVSTKNRGLYNRLYGTIKKNLLGVL